MAKGQVSEEQLSRGVKGFGSFDGLTSTRRVRRDNPFGDSRAEAAVPEPSKSPPTAPEVLVKKAREPNLKRLSHKTAPVAGELSKPVGSASKGREATKSARVRKADIFTEKISVPMSPEMRDDLERIARELQRSKRSKQERITVNTVVRAAIWLITQRFELAAGEAPNGETELYECVKRAVSAGSS